MSQTGWCVSSSQNIMGKTSLDSFIFWPFWKVSLIEIRLTARGGKEMDFPESRNSRTLSPQNFFIFFWIRINITVRTYTISFYTSNHSLIYDLCGKQKHVHSLYISFFYLKHIQAVQSVKSPSVVMLKLTNFKSTSDVFLTYTKTPRIKRETVWNCSHTF